jgi:hypothetical protein
MALLGTIEGAGNYRVLGLLGSAHALICPSLLDYPGASAIKTVELGL